MNFDLKTFTIMHVVISLIGIASGFVIVYGLLIGRRFNGWTALFLVTTVATSVTGFGFPLTHFGAPHWVGVVSLIVLAVATFARYIRHLNGAWRWIYVIGAVVALYLNVFVGVVQAFQKIPALNALAPTQSEPTFFVTQLGVMALFILLAIVAARRFHLEPVGSPVRAS